MIISQRGLCVSCRRKNFLKLKIDGTTNYSEGDKASSVRDGPGSSSNVYRCFIRNVVMLFSALYLVLKSMKLPFFDIHENIYIY